MCQRMILYTYRLVCGGLMETKELIIETAFIAFVDYGYDRVSLNQIIKSTGLTKGAFYHYFSSKDELITEVMHTYFFKHLQNTMDFVEVENQSFRERMNIVLNNALNIDIRLKSDPKRELGKDDFLKLLWESMNLNEEMKKMNHQYQMNIIKLMTRVIESGKRENAVREDIDAESVAKMMVSSVRGSIMMSNQLSKNESEDILKDNMNTIIELIEKKN